MSEEHTFVSPGPACLGALAVACFGFGAVFTGKVGLGRLPLLTAVTPSYLKSPLPLFLIVVLLDIVLWMIVGLDMDKFGAEIKPIIGYLLYATGWITIYLVAAIVNNNIYGRVILPTFGVIVK